LKYINEIGIRSLLLCYLFIFNRSVPSESHISPTYTLKPQIACSCYIAQYLTALNTVWYAKYIFTDFDNRRITENGKIPEFELAGGGSYQNYQKTTRATTNPTIVPRQYFNIRGKIYL